MSLGGDTMINQTALFVEKSLELFVWIWDPVSLFVFIKISIYLLGIFSLQYRPTSLVHSVLLRVDM